jgi:hypothetical protein
MRLLAFAPAGDCGHARNQHLTAVGRLRLPGQQLCHKPDELSSAAATVFYGGGAAHTVTQCGPDDTMAAALAGVPRCLTSTLRRWAPAACRWQRHALQLLLLAALVLPMWQVHCCAAGWGLLGLQAAAWGQR